MECPKCGEKMNERKTIDLEKDRDFKVVAEEEDFTLTGEMIDAIMDGTLDADEIARKLDRATRLQDEREYEQEQKQVNDHKKPSQVTLFDFIHSEARVNE